MAREFPKIMFHRSLAPVSVDNREKQSALGPDWSERYIHQEYPRILYAPDGSTRKVSSDTERDSLLTPKDGSPAYSLTPFPAKAEAVKGDALAGSLRGTDNTETLQRLQIVEFELEAAKEQIQALNGAVTDLRMEIGGFRTILADLAAPQDEEQKAEPVTKHKGRG